ncbi:MAG: hypothetical protein IKH88_12665 [Prevotella sp.]|nr:hypothetical protein [Prevotella sp.]
MDFSDSIFLPATGFRTYILQSAGSEGFYWSSNPQGYNNDILYFYNDGGLEPFTEMFRSNGHPVRPVSE